MEHNFPQDFIRSLEDAPGCDVEELLRSLCDVPPVSIRVNEAKYHQQVDQPKVPWTTNAYYLDRRPVFTLDPLFHAGAYYVQEASSMLIQHVFRGLFPDPSGITVLDACAAPGGKTTLLASLLGSQSLLVANEHNRQRANILSENVQKWGLPNVVVTNGEANRLGQLPQFFDALVVDAPCSGEGMFRKLDIAQEEWSVQNIQMCQARQKQILEDLWPSLKDGGCLIYSTCTFNTAENENIATWVAGNLGARGVSIDIHPDWGIFCNEQNDVTTYRCYPGKCKGEGFTLTVLRKESVTVGIKARYPKINKYLELVKTKEQPTLWQWINHENFALYRDQSQNVYSFLAAFEQEVDILGSVVKIVQPGASVASIKGKDLIPDPSFALSIICNRPSFDIVEVDANTSLRYFAKTLNSIDTASNGWKLLVHNGIATGFVKVIGNRINNSYPQEWRIRMNYGEADVEDVLRFL